MDSETQNSKQPKNTKKNLLFYLFYTGSIVGLAGYLWFITRSSNQNRAITPLSQLHRLFFHRHQAPITELQNSEGEAIYVEVYQVTKEDSQVTFDTYGTIVGAQEQTIAFDMSGKISLIGENRQIKKGDVYLALDSSQLQWKKEGCIAQLLAKKSYLKRLKELHKSDLASITQVEEIKKDIATLEAQAGEIEVQMSSMILTAPCDGYFFVKNTAASVGAVVQARQELGYFFSLKKQIKFYIPHSHLMGLEPGEEIKVIFFPDFDSNQEPIEGNLLFDLKYIRPVSSHESEHNPQMCEANADLVKDEAVAPMFYNQNGKIRLIFNKKNNYHLIPEIAIITRGAKSFVYVIQDNRAMSLEIHPLGTNKQGYVRVKQADIGDNTIIVLRGLNKVSHMAKVKVVANMENPDTENDKKARPQK